LSQAWAQQAVTDAARLFQLRSPIASRPNSALQPLLELLTKVLGAYNKFFRLEHRRAQLGRPIFEYCWSVVTDAGRAPGMISDDLAGPLPLKLVVQAIGTIRGVLVMWPSTELGAPENVPCRLL
jgi:hypothetical protein